MRGTASLTQIWGGILLVSVCTGIILAQTGGTTQTAAPPSGGTSSGGGTGGTVGGGGNVPGGVSPSVPTRPTQPTQPTIQPQERTSFPSEIARPIFLSGRVLMEDGTPPPEPVVIERVCNGIARPEAYTDSKGHFSFQLGGNTNVFPDASVSSAADGAFGGMRGGFPGPGGREFTERDLAGCEIRASLAGFRSEAIALSGRRFLDNPELGVIVLRRMGNVEGLTISATSTMASKDARKAFEKGREAFKRKKWADAAKELEKAVSLHPKYAVAWFYLGLVREQQKDISAARKAYEQALAADAKYVNPYLQLAQIAAMEGKWEEAADTSARLIKLNPFDFPFAFFVNAVANYNLKRYDEAEESARNAIRNDPGHRMAKAHHLLGVILAQKQEYAQAAIQMRNYLQYAPKAPDAEQVKRQLAEMEKAAQGR